MTKLLIGLLGAAVLATGGYAAAAGLDDAEPARTVSLPGATTSDDTGLTTGATTTTTTGTTTTVEDDIVVGTAPVGTTTVDISGPCDEAEHANDPRCTGADSVEHDDDDNSGRGSGDDDHDDDHGGNDDRSGSNSGSDHDDD